MSGERQIRTAVKTLEAAEANWAGTNAGGRLAYMAAALESAQLLQSPETAAEHAHYRAAFEAQRSRAETLDALLRTAQARVAELEAAQGTVYRASHDSIAMGLYTTAAEARAHCVAEERRSWAAGETVVFDWIEDEEDGVAELVTVDEDGETESVTGYVVTALEVAAKYDPDGDE
ncbi:hypothetical protein ACIRPR_06365 [Streptomyces griseoflavus]|uniref:hypothetical protein n=1 Tax=Streptomyces griseoflavus TaxID=35619 RepID=UPI003814C16C